MSARENAQKHFDKYNKLKRTFEALSQLTQETKEEIDHLESISAALDIALEENDLVQIKEELMEYGYIEKTPRRRKTAENYQPSVPLFIQRRLPYLRRQKQLSK